MFVGVMNLTMNAAMGRPAVPHMAQVQRRSPDAPVSAARARPARSRASGHRGAVSRSAGLATYQIYAEAFRAAARAL